MKIIAGLMEPSSGEIRFAKGAKAAYLPQDGVSVSGRTLFQDAHSAFSELLEMEKELHKTAEALELLSPGSGEHEKLLMKYGEIQEIFRHRGGYSMESEIGTVLKGLGFKRSDWLRDTGEFSGGWQMRIALAKLLLKSPDILLLDEPTNHLDIEARNWLEEYLSTYPGSVILVSHDRFFMDSVCSRIAEVWNHTVTDYHCNYSRYLAQREERVAALREAKRIQDEEIQKSEDFIRRFRYQANKASLVQSRIKQLEKIERIVLPPERKRIRFRFPPAPGSGKVIMELKGVTKSYGPLKVLDQVCMTVEKGERLALVGHNGAGKSTLMSVLAGRGFDSGERIVGHNVIPDYFAQNQAEVLDFSKTVYGEIYADAPFDMTPKLRDILGAFLFAGDDAEKPVSVLSGGERNRLALAKMLLKPSNLLLMDEPTNHLDLFSKDVLLDALRSFEGTVIFVSHDRYFVNALATRVVEVENGSLENFYGNYEYYLEKKEGAFSSEHCGNASHAVPLKRTSENFPSPLPGLPGEARRGAIGREEQKRKKKEEEKRERELAGIESEISLTEREIEKLEREDGRVRFFRRSGAGT